MATKQIRIGLRRGIVALSPYDKCWAIRFGQERHALQRTLGVKALDIQHIGSTSVPGLSAKPIIDIALGIRDLKTAAALKPAFEKLGYAFRPNAGGRYRLFFAKGPEMQRTIYLHVMRFDGAEWHRLISFRDHLRAHPAVRNRYAVLKKTLAKKFANDRPKYTAWKSAFIQKILQLTREK